MRLPVMRLVHVILFMTLSLNCHAVDSAARAEYQRVMEVRERVLALLRSTPRLKLIDRGDVLIFVDAEKAATFFVTEAGHPAHPAMVTQRFTKVDGQQVSKFDHEAGGDIAAFQKWLAEISANAKEAIEHTSASNTIGYPSVQVAIAALKKKPGARLEEREGWTIVEDQEAGDTVLWSFVPTAHPAYPAAVKRTILEKDGGLYVDMKVQCQATKPACDELVRSFQKLNEQMKLDIKAKKNSGKYSPTPQK